MTKNPKAEATLINTSSQGTNTFIPITVTFLIILHISQNPLYGLNP